MMRLRKFWPFLAVFSLIFYSIGINPPLSYSATLTIPSNIQVTPSVDTTYLNGNINVSWGVVSGATAYSIKVTNTSTNSYNIETVNGESNNQVVITNLVGGETYSVQVRTIKAVEYSDWSSASLTTRPTTLPKAPSKPTVSAATGGATVSWVALTTSELGGGELVNYIAREILSGTSITVSAVDTTATFTNLTNGAKANFTVTAVTNVSSSGSTSPVSDEIVIGEVANPGASSSPTPTPSSTSTSNSNNGGGGSGGGGSGGGGSVASRPILVQFIVVNPEDLGVIYKKPICIGVYTGDFAAQLLSTVCSFESGVIELELVEGSYSFRVYESGKPNEFLSYSGKVQNTIFSMSDAKLFPGTARYALTVPKSKTPSPSPSVSTTVSPLPSPTQSNSVSPSPTISPASSPTPQIKYIATCIKGKLTKKIIGATPKCPSGYKLKSKVVYKPITYVATCAKGKTIKKITGVSPKCPTGFKLTSKKVLTVIKPAPKKTLVCVSGKSTKKVVAAKPICPKGYKPKG